MAESVEWLDAFNTVHVRIRQGLRGHLELLALGTQLRVIGGQYTDLSRTPTPTHRTRTLGLAGLQARWEAQNGFRVHGTGVGELVLARPGRPDVHLPDLRVRDEDVEAVCAALAAAAEAASVLQGHGRYEVPRGLRGLLADLEED